MNKIKGVRSTDVVSIALAIMLCACATSPDTAAESDLENTTRPEKLSDYKKTKVETSNGTIDIAPTVVAVDDEALEGHALENGGEYYDPLESVNRAVFSFNHYSYKYLLIPVAKGYNAVLPDPVKASVSNVFDNIREPLNLINNTVSGELSEAGSNLGRFLINSTVGLLGLFDPADAWFGLKERPQTVAQTLMKYKVGSGAYIVLPFLGQSDVRGTTSVISESIFHPTKYVLNSPDDIYARATDSVSDFSSQAELYITLYEQASDPYEYFRNEYIQSVNRNEKSEALSERNTTSEMNATAGKKYE